jgi:MFS family permease
VGEFGINKFGGKNMSTMTAASARPAGMTKDERFVILASSLGTVFEWYDFYLYGSLASIIGAQFFSDYPPATRDIFALLAFAAGFLVRPFGAIVFGRVGDIVGRKYTFLVTILIMGLSTFIVGLLPNAKTIGIAAPIILIALRLLQGLALGGEYGGAATYVAEHSPQGKRGYYTSFIQTTATLGLFLSLLVILFTRSALGEPEFAAWGWRIPFLVSVLLLGISVWIRLRLNESPVFQKMKDEGKSLCQLEQRQDRAAGPDRWHHGPGCGLVHRPVLRAVLPAIDPQGGRLHGEPPDRLVAAVRHRLLHRVRRSVRQDRPQADHFGGLPDRGADLLPDLPDDHHQR